MRVQWSLAVGIAAFVGVLGLLVLPHFEWGHPEQPPRAQGEALAMRSDGTWNYRADLPSAGVREPQNTWTNLAYVIAGAALGLAASTTVGRTLGVALCFLGVGSGLYHASATDHWRLIDVIGMYWTIFLLISLSLQAVTRQEVFAGPFAALLGSAAGIVMAVFRNDIRIAGLKPFDSTYVTIAGFSVVTVALMLTAFRGRDRTLILRVVACLVAAVIAVVARLGDQVNGIWFDPAGLFQGHAVWHVASAVALYLAVDVFQRQWTHSR